MPAPLPAARRASALAVLGGAAAMLSAASPARAAAVPSCSAVVTPKPVVADPGFLESIAFDPSGRLLYTSLAGAQVRVLASPEGKARTLTAGIEEPGGLLVEPGGRRAWVTSGSGPGAQTPPAKATLYSIDLRTGRKTLRARGITMGNGLVRSAKGVFYASDTFGGTVDRIDPTAARPVRLAAFDGMPGANGLGLSPDGKTLYVNRSAGGGTAAITLATGKSRTFVAVPSDQPNPFLDGLAVAADGTLFAAAFSAGEVWKITPKGVPCVLARGLKSPTMVAIGRSGKGFSARSVFVTSAAGGGVVELRKALPAA